MPLSTRKDDNTSQPLGEGYITMSTSAGNALVFRSPAEANAYRINNPAQFYKGGVNNTSPDGNFNTQYQQPAQS